MSDEKANNDPLSRAFNVVPMDSDGRSSAVSKIVADAHDDSAKADFEIARSNLHGIIDQGSYALSQLASIAEQSQHPAMFDAMTNMMNVLIKANRDLLNLQKDIRTIDKASAPMSDEAKQINDNRTQNLFVGSTADLARAIESMKDKK